MKYKLNDKEIELLERVSKQTATDYRADNDGYIEIEALLDAIDTLMSEIEYQEEKYEDLEQDLRENYKPKSNYELYGVSEKDFYEN